MPYIPEMIRRQLVVREPDTPGELNYVITEACLDYIKKKGLSYTTINDVLGALSGSTQEFYRRVASPYEDTKIEKNGDLPFPEIDPNPKDNKE